MSASPTARGAAPSAADVAKARGQFQQALALETAGDYSGALNLLREVSAVKMTPQVRFHIATCEDHLGKLLAAAGDYQLALGDAQEVNADDVVKEATERLALTRARIPTIVIKRGSGAVSAQISLDGQSLGAPSIGKPIQVDPGPHTIEARSPGSAPFSKQLDVAEKEVKTVEVVLTKAVEPGIVAPVASASGSPEPPPPPTETKRSILPYAVGGAGVALLATSGVFFLLRAGAVKDLDAACGPNRDACPASSKSTFDSGKTYSILGDITLAAGIVGVGVGTYLLLSAPSDAAATSTSTAMRIVPSAPGGLVGGSLVGRF